MDSELTLRRATKDDARILFDWRNDPETRRYSKQHDEVTWEEHIAWLSKTLETDSTRLLYIAEREGKSVGTVRGDTLSGGVVEISYTVAPEARGKGIAKPMVRQFVQEILPSGTSLVAHVRKGHVPSERVAESLGLKPVSELAHEEGRPAMVEWR